MHMHCSAQQIDAEPAQDRPQSFTAVQAIVFRLSEQNCKAVKGLAWHPMN